jgi:hypothetical protein
MNPINDQPLFFSVKHIISPIKTKLIYGIRFKDLDYFLYKTFGLNDCEQLDSNSKLDPEIFNMMCEVITEIEKEYNRTPPLEFINMDVFNILVNAKNPRYEEHGMD